MKLTRYELAAATAAVRELLERLALKDYRFVVEPLAEGCDVRLEYAATDGWRTAVLHVAGDELLASRNERATRQELLQRWGERLHHALHRPSVEEALMAEAIALGRAWAHGKADELRDRVPASEWPDFWDAGDNEQLPGELNSAELARARAEATRAARERWSELVVEQRSSESTEEGEQGVDAAATQLEAQLRAQL